VHDATLANGTMRIIPGSFREQYEHSRDPYSNAHIRCYPPEERAVAIEVPAGGVAFFCYGTPHSTGDNSTGRPRAAVAYHYTHFAFRQPANPKDPFVTGPKADPSAWDHVQFERLLERTVASGPTLTP
jgi:ectoine hydroxylase-related dioxygenase (phytanoyl-CoA dioxygenase family)